MSSSGASKLGSSSISASMSGSAEGLIEKRCPPALIIFT